MLEQPYKEKWIMRHNYDYIVILDQGTEDIEEDLKLIHLRNALLRWDQLRDNSKKLKFLKGGYEDFNHLCPWETSQYEETKLNRVIEHLSDVELDDPELECNKSYTNIKLY